MPAGIAEVNAFSGAVVDSEKGLVLFRESSGATDFA